MELKVSTDDTLTESGKAADAKAVGEEIEKLSEAVADEVADREAAVADVKAQMIQQTPLFANSIEECTDTSKVYVLPDGYIYAYKKTDVDGGEPLFTNQADPTSSDWLTDYRFSSSSGSNSACTGAIVTNAISAKKGDILRIKGLQDGSTSVTASAYFGVMGYSDTEGTTKVTSTPTYFNKTKEQNGNGVKDLVTVVDGVTTHTLIEIIGNDGTIIQRDNVDNVVTIRVSGEPITTVDDIVITINEEIVYSEASSEYMWANTGRAFVPADYEDRIIDVEAKAESNEDRLDELEVLVENGLEEELTDSEKLKRIKYWDKPVFDFSPVTLIEDERAKPALTTSDRTIDAVYAKYRELMEQYPTYITETNLGACTSSDTFEAIDMLRFDFKEPDGLRNTGYELYETKPKIIFLTGIHNEYVGIWSLYYALEEIVSNPDFGDIRRNAHIIVIPCANPYGLVKPLGEYNTPSHVNANGVAPHNNFGVDWVLRGEVGDYNYSGTEPYSELETQYIDKVMQDNSDAIAFVSCHNNDWDTEYGAPVIWASSATAHMCNVVFRLIDKMSKAWINKYGDTLKEAIDTYKTDAFPDGEYYRLGRAQFSTSAGTEQLNATKYGIQGTNVEVSRIMHIFSGDVDGSSEVVTHGAEVYANLIRTLLSVYNYKDKEEYYK